MHSVKLDDDPTAPVELLDEPSGDSEMRFCKIVADGNRAAELRDTVLATQLFEEAIVEADSLFASGRTDACFLIAPITYTIACNNAAEVKLTIGDVDSAYELKFQAVSRLIAVAQSPAEPLVLRLSCVRQLRNAIVFLAAVPGSQKPAQLIALESLVERCREISAELSKIATAALSIDEGRRILGSELPSGSVIH